MLVPCDDGCPTDSDDFYRLVHAAFAGQAGALTYLGFERAGPPVHAPLFALALLYKRYGRGRYKAGDILPTPCRETTVGVAYASRPDVLDFLST